MAQVDSISSNVVGLRIAEETSPGVLPGTPDWIEREPNSFPEAPGGSLTLTARNPISQDSQRKKGNITDLDASGNFVEDLTQENGQTLLEGFFRADLRRKGEETPTGVTASTDIYSVASTTGFQVGDLIFGAGFGETANNGLKRVTTVTTDTSVTVAEALTDEGSPTGTITVVGHQAGSADLDVDITGSFPAITSTTLDFTTLGLVVGEIIFVGGDAAGVKFATAANNGPKRVRSIAANRLEFDKSTSDMSNETGTGLTIQLFIGRVLKNESDPSNIVFRTYQQELQMGAPDGASPADIQAIYIPGCSPSQVTLSIPTAGLATMEYNFLGTDFTTVDGPTSLKTGDRTDALGSEAFNTTSDFNSIRFAVHDEADEAPDALFAFATEMSIVINNNVAPNKAIANLGAFSMNYGVFQVSATATVYFNNVSQLDAVRGNSNVTIGMFLSKSNAGIAIDLPLGALGAERPSIDQNTPITQTINFEAASGRPIATGLDHTIMMVFFDYLPTAAG